MCILKHKNVVINGSDIVRAAPALFQFYIKIRCRFGCRKVDRGFFDLALQIVTNFEKKNLPKPLCAGRRKHFCLTSCMVTGKSTLLLGYYMRIWMVESGFHYSLKI